MRKLLFFTLAVSVIATISGCLKDKEFENEEYGIQIKEVKGVTFTQAIKSPIVIGILSQSSSQTVDGPLLALEQDGVPSTDVKVTIAIDNSLIPAGYVAMPVGAFSINSLTVTIPSGKKISDFLKIVIPNASTLDATKIYAVGLKISSVDQGYTISGNMSKIVIAFTVKNPYDGVYQATGWFYHPTAPRAINEVKDVLTINATTSEVYLGDLGTAGYIAWFIVDPATNNVTITPAPGAAGGAYTMFTSGLPNSNPGYTNAWPGGPQCNNRYDPATKTFYVRYGYLGGTGWRVTEEKIVRQ
jgi:hypothetical protein